MSSPGPNAEADVQSQDATQEHQQPLLQEKSTEKKPEAAKVEDLTDSSSKAALNKSPEEIALWQKPEPAKSVGDLTGKCCIITGGALGLGRTLAYLLARAGAEVWVTDSEADRTWLESIEYQVNEGKCGKAVVNVVDHSKVKDVEAFFRKFEREHKGRFVCLVNNAFSGSKIALENRNRKFYDMDPDTTWDSMNEVCLKNNYVCSTFAARLFMKNQNQNGAGSAPEGRGDSLPWSILNWFSGKSETQIANGLIINMSSSAGLSYSYNAAYGIGKAAVDRMSRDCAIDLKDKNIAMISVWPGDFKDWFLQDVYKALEKNSNRLTPGEAENLRAWKMGSSAEFVCNVIRQMLLDKNIMEKTGRAIYISDLALEYGIEAKNGQINDMRSIKRFAKIKGYETLSWFIPERLRLPYELLYFAGYKF